MREPNLQRVSKVLATDMRRDCRRRLWPCRRSWSLARSPRTRQCLNPCPSGDNHAIETARQWSSIACDGNRKLTSSDHCPGTLHHPALTVPTLLLVVVLMISWRLAARSFASPRPTRAGVPPPRSLSSRHWASTTDLLAHRVKKGRSPAWMAQGDGSAAHTGGVTAPASSWLAPGARHVSALLMVLGQLPTPLPSESESPSIMINVRTVIAF